MIEGVNPDGDRYSFLGAREGDPVPPEVPLVSLGQGEYRRDIYPRDVSPKKPRRTDVSPKSGYRDTKTGAASKGTGVGVAGPAEPQASPSGHPPLSLTPALIVLACLACFIAGAWVGGVT